MARSREQSPPFPLWPYSLHFDAVGHPKPGHRVEDLAGEADLDPLAREGSAPHPLTQDARVLAQENLMPLDVKSGNIWSQMLLRRFQGDAGMGEVFAFRELSTFPLIETVWLTVRDHFPEARVYMDKSGMKSVKKGTT